MLPRPLLALLAVMNLSVALWWTTYGAAPMADTATTLPAGVPGLRLVDETASAQSTGPALRCCRFGPYSDGDTLAAARGLAEGIAASVDVVTLPGPAPRAWRVVAPLPEDGDSAAL